MLTPKENYLRMLRGEIPEYVPSMYEKRRGTYTEDFLTPQSAPNGPIVTKLGVRYVGSEKMMNGALPDPNREVLKDIKNWRDWVKLPDISDFDFEKYYADKIKHIDRSQQYISVTGGDYFLTLVSIMEFNNAFVAVYQDPDEVIAMLEYISTYYLEILKKQIYYIKPEAMTLMDDDSAYKNPFFNLKTYQKIFKPFHKLHCDLALENGMVIERHDCGRCEQFIPDWLEMGISGWNPAQTSNDLKGIKQKYGNRLAICGGWHSLDWDSDCDLNELRDAMVEYVDTLAPGGGFSFMAGVSGKAGDPKLKERQDFIKNFYFDYVHDYYKTHH